MRRRGNLVTAEQHCSSEAAVDIKMQRLNSPNVLCVSTSAQSCDYVTASLDTQKQIVDPRYAVRQHDVDKLSLYCCTSEQINAKAKPSAC